MAYRVAIQLFFFLLPFIVFGLYLLATADAERDGRRKWPIQVLFLCGLALSTVIWFANIFMDEQERDVCIEPPRYENGELIPARSYPCEQDVQNLGVPRNNDPGGEATGVTYPDDLRDTSEISASAPDAAKDAAPDTSETPDDER